jgi:hypothetical protein
VLSDVHTFPPKTSLPLVAFPDAYYSPVLEKANPSKDGDAKPWA